MELQYHFRHKAASPKFTVTRAQTLKPISNKKELTFLKPADFLNREFNEYTFQSETTTPAK